MPPQCKRSRSPREPRGAREHTHLTADGDCKIEGCKQFTLPMRGHWDPPIVHLLIMASVNRSQPLLSAQRTRVPIFPIISMADLPVLHPI